MKTYHVEWEIEIDAEDEREAARKALAIQRNPSSTATVFTVTEFDSPKDPWSIDLLAIEEEF